MARLFYHRPRYAILDECTSGVTVDMEERFCSRVKALGCTCITISHRPALVRAPRFVVNTSPLGLLVVLSCAPRQVTSLRTDFSLTQLAYTTLRDLISMHLIRDSSGTMFQQRLQLS